MAPNFVPKSGKTDENYAINVPEPVPIQQQISKTRRKSKTLSIDNSSNLNLTKQDSSNNNEANVLECEIPETTVISGKINKKIKMTKKSNKKLETQEKPDELLVTANEANEELEGKSEITVKINKKLKSSKKSNQKLETIEKKNELQETGNSSKEYEMIENPNKSLTVIKTSKKSRKLRNSKSVTEQIMDATFMEIAEMDTVLDGPQFEVVNENVCLSVDSPEKIKNVLPSEANKSLTVIKASKKSRKRRNSKSVTEQIMDATLMEIAEMDRVLDGPQFQVVNENVCLSVDSPEKIKNVLPSEANKSTSKDSECNAASTGHLNAESDEKQKSYEAFCTLQEICSSLGINVEQLFASKKLTKRLKSNVNSDAYAFIQGHTLKNGQTTPSVYMHDFKEQLEDLLHKFRSES